MSIAVDVRRVFAIFGFDRFRIVQPVCECPVFNDVVADPSRLDGPLFAEEIERFFQIARIDIGGALQGGAGSAGKADDGQSQVFPFDVWMLAL